MDCFWIVAVMGCVVIGVLLEVCDSVHQISEYVRNKK